MKTIEDLRSVLFETIDAVKNNHMDLDKARTINDLGKTLIDTAKVEVDFLRVTEGQDSKFLGGSVQPAHPLPQVTDGPRNGITGIVQHRLAG